MRQGGGRIRHPGPLRANDVSRFPGLRRFPSPGCYFVVGVLFVVLLYSAGLFPGPAGAPVRAPPPAITPAALVGNVTGSVFGSRGPGTTPVPLPGVEVNATDPDFVTTVASSVTNASGEYALTVPPGFYYIWSHRSGAWGGGGVPDRINVSAGNQTVNLTAYPYLGYGNSTLVLPDWNRLAPYLHKGNAMDSQQPMLSWSQDGAFYVNATDQLVFYSFPNRTVTDIAPWVPLYENVMNYAGWENEEFLTPDGSWVYGLGCLASCTSSTHVTLYAVNVSTGRTFEYNWTTVDGNLTTNAQVNLVGTEGNLSTAVLIDDKGHLWLYSLWNGTEWRGPALPYFEANNIYWIPYLSSYVNVEAEGATTDGIDQWALHGPGDGTTFTDVFSSHYGSGFLSNAVTGPAFNLSSRTLVFDSFSKGSWYTFEYNVTPGNVLDDLTVLDAQVPGISTYADEKLTIDITADEHRASLLEGGPAFSAAFWPFFDNRSFVVDPFSQVFYDTNQTPGVFYNTTNSPDQAAASSDSEDGLYFNASYLISPGAYDCDAGTCPINGGNGSAIGTIWWLWKVGGPEFPTPVTAPLSQDAAPGPITVTNSTGATNVQLNWTSPDVGQYPLLNYTVEWGLTPGSYSHSVSMPSAAQGFNITGLPPQGPVYYAVTTWNLHWHGPVVQGVATIQEDRPVAPTGLAAMEVTVNSLTLQWLAPPQFVSSYALLWGTVCGAPTDVTNLSAIPHVFLAGLRPHTLYCFVVQAWNQVGGSPLSAHLLVLTGSEFVGRHVPVVPTIPYVPPPAVHPTGPPCGGFCFPSVPNPGQPQYWAGAAVALTGGVLALRGRRAIGGATLALGILLFFL
ncbi:MAG: fibronectin type III domain-containing protein [Thermoplasmata archaeon]